MARPRLVGFSANIQRPSKTRAMVEAIADRAAGEVALDVRLFDMVDAGPALGSAWSRDALSLPARRIVEAIEEADALVVASPVYKGAYTGLFKHLFDLVGPDALIDTPVAIAATGGGPRHALVVEHAFRPLFGFFGAQTIPTAVYASDADFQDGVLRDDGVIQRVADAGGQLARAILSRSASVEDSLALRSAAR
ncbi:FMN reductase [Methylobacterium sp. Leaf466]|uniref:FMN reductase n=1 Tax=Methylobacterium sp. Leaf466 TaxID=1736386 RepID=UPI0006FBA204|nr:FMN reductase [Methylobacterium sp. Leaf466]KQT80596.1 FMN reductase [Methylobacterium sp. Leaf466]